MKKGLLVLSMFLALMMTIFGTSSYAAIGDCDFSVPKDGDIDGIDLSRFIAYYAESNPLADVNTDGLVNPDDVAHFAGFFGGGYTVIARRPNILLIVGDDIGFDVTTDMYPNLIQDLVNLYGPAGHNDGDYQNIDPREYGGGHGPASTPVLDSFASQGMRFSNAWAQPFCSPTRASIMTGLYTAKHNVTTYATYLSENYTTFVQMLKEDAGYGDGGYSTAAFGKWHLAGDAVQPGPGMMPRQAGFDLYRGSLGAAPNGGYWASTYVVQDGSQGEEGYDTVTVTPRTLNEGSTDQIGPTRYMPVVKASETIEWITQQESEHPGKPWFVYLPFNMSHATAGGSWMVVPDADTLDAETHAEIAGCLGSTGSFGGTSVGNCNGKQLMRAMTNSMDTVIGRVLDKIKDLDPNTYIIYISDNGTPMYGNIGVMGEQIGNMYITTAGRGKGTAYESGVHVPMIIKGPGIEAGQSSEFVHVADLFSTILELAGRTPPVDVPDGSGGTGTVSLDAVSLAPILFDGADTVRDPDSDCILSDAINIMGTSTTWVAARNARYKLVCSGSSSNCNYYDLAGDPSENILGDPLEEYPLTKPGSCTNYTNGTWTPETNPVEWNYCRLLKMINDNSIF